MARANVDVVQGRRSALVGSRLVQARRMLAEGKSQVEVAHRRIPAVLSGLAHATIQRAVAAQ
jgi:hypothetical protein